MEDMEKDSLPVVLQSRTLLIAFTLLSFLSFAIPFSLGHPQIIVGSIVNASLFLSAIFLPEKFIYPVILMPSLAVLSRGIIFGPLTPFLVLMIPFIWVGNWLLVFVFKKVFNLYRSDWLAIFMAALLKFIFLFSAANLMFKLNLVPKIFLTTMGVLQFVTASLGGVLAFLTKQFYARFSRT